MSLGTTLAVPLLRVEARSRLRDWRSFALLTVYLSVMSAVEGSFLLRDTGSSTDSELPPGVQLFDRLALVQLGLLFVLTPLVVAGAASGDRQRGTWDLLLTVPLSSVGIACGKVGARLSFVLLLIVMGLPLMAVSFLYADFSVADALPTYGVTLATAVLLSVVTFAISIAARRVTTAFMGAMGAAAILSIVLTALTVALSGNGWRSYDAGSSGRPVSLPAVAQVDAAAALDSALPGSSVQPVTDRLISLPVRLYLWESYAILSLLASILILTWSVHSVRLPAASRRGPPATVR